MSKRRDQRQRRQHTLRDVRRDYLASLERRGRLQTTPPELRWQAVTEPFYLRDLGLAPVNRGPTKEPRYEPGPVIRTDKRA